MSSSLTPEACLAPTRFIESTHPEVLERVEALQLRRLSETERAVALFRHVRDDVQYEFMAKLTPEEYLASHVLRTGRGFCVQKGVLLCALSRAAGVPCALVLSDLRDESLSPRVVKAMGTDTMFHHGLNAFFLEGRWLKADASLSPDVTTRKQYRPVEFDGTADALHSATTLTGAPHATYVRFHGLYAELPFEQMIDAFARGYQRADVEALAAIGNRM
ncbi:MAG: transglutaminase family protein [Myxococcaceae bacterium]|nr:transglutaminase family protein [Myxococcaceae bacterium]